MIFHSTLCIDTCLAGILVVLTKFAVRTANMLKQTQGDRSQCSHRLKNGKLQVVEHGSVGE